MLAGDDIDIKFSMFVPNLGYLTGNAWHAIGRAFTFIYLEHHLKAWKGLSSSYGQQKMVNISPNPSLVLMSKKQSFQCVKGEICNSCICKYFKYAEGMHGERKCKNRCHKTVSVLKTSVKVKEMFRFGGIISVRNTKSWYIEFLKVTSWVCGSVCSWSIMIEMWICPVEMSVQFLCLRNVWCDKMRTLDVLSNPCKNNNTYDELSELILINASKTPFILQKSLGSFWFKDVQTLESNRKILRFVDVLILTCMDNFII